MIKQFTKVFLIQLTVIGFLLTPNIVTADQGDPCTDIGRCGGACNNDEVCQDSTSGPYCDYIGSYECSLIPPACVPYGALCGSSSPWHPTYFVGCCNAVNCTAQENGERRCGDFFQDEPVEPTDYTGPIVDFESLIKNAYKLLLPIAIGVVGIPIVLFGGYKLMTSQGDPGKVKVGKEDFTAGVAGILFLLLALSILRIILGNFFGQ